VDGYDRTGKMGEKRRAMVAINPGWRPAIANGLATRWVFRCAELPMTPERSRRRLQRRRTAGNDHRVVWLTREDPCRGCFFKHSPVDSPRPSTPWVGGAYGRPRRRNDL